jgi:hypothetical protein
VWWYCDGGHDIACFPLVQVKRVYSGLLDTREERWAQVRQSVSRTAGCSAFTYAWLHSLLAWLPA